MYYSNLFRMCGFEENEIDAQSSRIELFLKKLKLDNDLAIKHCEDTVNKNYDVSLKGVRGLLRVFIKETLDIALAREEREKVVTFTRPVDPVNAITLICAEKRYGERVYARSAVQMVCMCLGTVFDRVNWLIEIGEFMGQTAGRAHCSEYQIYAGGMREGIFPIPDMSISCGWYCDQSPEADVLLSEMYGYPIVATDGCNDWQWGSWPELDERAVRYMRKTLQNAHEKVAEITGIEITQEDAVEAMQASAMLTMSQMNITQLMAEADPQPVSQGDLTLVFFTWCQGTFYMDDAVKALNDLQKEIHQRIKKGIGVVPEGAPRVFVQLRYCVDMTPIKSIEEFGLAIPIMFFDSLHPNQLTPTKFPDDPLAQAIEGVFKMPKMGDNSATLEFWKWMAESHKVDGVIHIYASSCRPWCTPALMGKKFVQEKLQGMPYILLEGDIFDTRNYSAGQIKTRLESFAEMLMMNKSGQNAMKST